MSLTLLLLMNLPSAPAASGVGAAVVAGSTGKVWTIDVRNQITWVV